MIAAKLRLEGINFNHKKVYRIYKKLGLNFKANSKSRKLPARKKILEIANNSNQIWSLDFMSGKINNRRFRTLNIIDEHARECLDIKILRSIPSNLVVNSLNQIIREQKRKPLAIRLDNGSEFTSYEFTAWAQANDIYQNINLLIPIIVLVYGVPRKAGRSKCRVKTNINIPKHKSTDLCFGISLFYIQAGKPYQNCYIERFNGTYRNEVLNKYIFDSIEELKEITEDWLIEYNYKRPHSSLGGLPPKIFLNQQNIANIDKMKNSIIIEKIVG